MINYLIKDRTTADVWAITVVQENIEFISSVGVPLSEPIIQDLNDSTVYWQLFVDQGVDGQEQVAKPSATSNLYFYDAVTKNTYLLIYSGGIIGIVEGSDPRSDTVRIRTVQFEKLNNIHCHVDRPFHRVHTKIDHLIHPHNRFEKIIRKGEIMLKKNIRVTVNIRGNKE